MIALLKLLPRVTLSRAFGRFARIHSPRWFAQLSVRLFAALYPRIDLGEAERPLGEYHSLVDFFTRRLLPGARPLSDSVLISPSDGAFGQSGSIEQGTLIQAKGVPYSLADFVGDPETAARFEGGAFCTIYLAPFNYHRVHMPISGNIVRLRHLPGDLWPVNRAAVTGIPGVFARNERAWVEIDTPHGTVIAVMVGAFNVGSIVLTACPALGHGTTGDWIPTEPIPVKAGDELGIFEMGSTVILLADKGVRAASLGISFPRAGEEVLMGAGLALPA